jgi:hypothetical protein
MAGKKRRRSRKRVTQGHHVWYEPPWVVPIFQGEHQIFTLLSWRKHTSQGFIIGMKEYIRVHEATAENLGKCVTPPEAFAVMDLASKNMIAQPEPKDEGQLGKNEEELGLAVTKKRTRKSQYPRKKEADV